MKPDFANETLNECFQKLEGKDAKGFLGCANSFLNGEIHGYLKDGAHRDEMRNFLSQAKDELCKLRSDETRDKTLTVFSQIVACYSEADKEFTDSFSLNFGKREIVLWLEMASYAIKANNVGEAKRWLELCEGKLSKVYGNDGLKVFNFKKNKEEDEQGVKKSDYWDWYKIYRKFERINKRKRQRI